MKKSLLSLNENSTKDCTQFVKFLFRNERNRTFTILALFKALIIFPNTNSNYFINLAKRKIPTASHYFL